MWQQNLVSVVVPVFNGERYLPAALASIAAQGYRPLEVLIVDDGSTDGSAEIATAFLRQGGFGGEVLQQPNQGPAAARNAGLARARGAWVAFMDADDAWLPDKTSLQRTILDEFSLVDVAWGQGIDFVTETLPELDTDVAAGARHMFLLQSMLFRRSILERVGLFDAQLPRSEDVDWLLRAMEQDAHFALHSDTVVYYRRHAGNLTNDVELTQAHFHRTLKRSLARRRQGAAPAGNLPPFMKLSSWRTTLGES